MTAIYMRRPTTDLEVEFYAGDVVESGTILIFHRQREEEIFVVVRHDLENGIYNKAVKKFNGNVH